MKTLIVEFCRAENAPGKFTGSKQYSYLGPDDAQIGEHYVVLSDTYCVVQVKEIKPRMPAAKKRVVCRVDTQDYEDYIKREEAIQALTLELDSRMAEMSVLNKYEMLAKADPNSADLLQKLRLLVGGNGPNVIEHKAD